MQLPEAEYVLGTGTDELARLALQNRLWADAAHAAWRLAELQAGHRVIDLGCGPGYAAFDLAEFVTPSGEVLAVDESATFIDHLNRQAQVRRLHHLRGVVHDVERVSRVVTDLQTWDMAYARWVLCFVRDPANVVRDVASVLRPGGRFVIQDYFNYHAMTMAPRNEYFDKAVAATKQSWEARGGDTDVMGRLPTLLRESGFVVEHLSVHARIARPQETMFQWPYTWWQIYAPKLVTMGLLSSSDCECLLQDLDAMRETGEGFIQCPLVYEIVALKK